MKFRAWDCIEKKWIELDKLFIGLDGSWVCQGLWALNYKAEDIIIEQYTGFADVNNDETCLGDILTDGDCAFYLIEWSKEVLGYILTNPKKKGFLLLSDINPRKWLLSGNIHENPGLLAK